MADIMGEYLRGGAGKRVGEGHWMGEKAYLDSVNLFKLVRPLNEHQEACKLDHGLLEVLHQRGATLFVGFVDEAGRKARKKGKGFFFFFLRGQGWVGFL